MTTLVRAAGLSGYEALAAELNLDVEGELRRAGLSRRALADPERLIPHTALMHLLEHSADSAQCPDFGLRLSQRQDIHILGPLAVVIEHASAVDEALRLASHYMFVHSPAIRFSIQPVSGALAMTDLCLEITMAHLPRCAQTLELSLGVLVQVIRLLGQGLIRPVSASVPHQRLGRPDAYRSALGCRCEFDAPITALRVPTAELQRPLSSRNPMLQKLGQSYLDNHFGPPASAFSDRVRGFVRQFMGAGDASRDAVARMLAVHPRTMHRRLVSEGTSFEAIRDDVRRERLEQLLARRDALPLSQVAAMIGYTEQAAMTRSCKRWFGCTPSELRGRMQVRP